MGDVQVPDNALYGAQTQRAVENFAISRLRLQRPFIKALGLIKCCAAVVNAKLGVLDHSIAERIADASRGVLNGDYDDQFVVDVFQTGSGTSTNMNANEIIAHLAGAHPNDHVNLSQSSNDVFPSAMHIAAVELIENELKPAMRRLQQGLAAKAEEFAEIRKIGRTHLQDAVPMTLGQEFSGYAAQVEQNLARIESTRPGLAELPLGGTAVGTGVNAAPGFACAVIEMISQSTSIAFSEARNHFEAQASRDAVCFLSGALKTYAVSLTKIANDIRLLGSGPRCGIGELKLPPTQPGSSIMPGKVNPVIAESVLMGCAQVIGYDAAITWCCAAGNLELNVMMPIMAYDVIESIQLLATVSGNLEERCIRGLEADSARAEGFIEQSLAMATMLVPKIGYDRAAAIAREAYESKRTIREIAPELFPPQS